MKRTPQMQRILDTLSNATFGMTDTEAHEQRICISCRGAVLHRHFRDEKSIKEYKISALCQGCQDRVFGRG